MTVKRNTFFNTEPLLSMFTNHSHLLPRDQHTTCLPCTRSEPRSAVVAQGELAAPFLSLQQRSERRAHSRATVARAPVAQALSTRAAAPSSGLLEQRRSCPARDPALPSAPPITASPMTCSYFVD